MLSARDVTVMWGGRLVLAGASLDMRPGRVVAGLGPNGAGKSTLLKAISREWPLSGGAVHLDGVDIAGLSAATLARHRAVVPQAMALAFPFTALEVVMLGATVPGFGLDTDQGPGANALAEVGLEGFETRRYTELSGGERQRVNIARALCQLDMSPAPATASKFLLLDEPTSSLDPAHQVALLNLLRARAEFGLGVVLVLHDINLAAAWADDIVLIGAGRIQAAGAVQDILDDKRLSALYGCTMRVNAVPPDGGVFVLPHHHRSDAMVAGLTRAYRD